MVKLLLENGADLERADNEGSTALMHAAGGGHAKAAKLLLENGADLGRADNEGWTALMYSVRRKSCGNGEIIIGKRCRFGAGG